MNKVVRICMFLFVITAFSLSISSTVQAEECPACSNRSLIPTPHNTSSAPGYCPSHGGSHLYEYIQDVAFINKNLVK